MSDQRSAHSRLLAELTPEQAALLERIEDDIRSEMRTEFYGPEEGAGWAPPGVIKGEVGTLEGPPIVGTTDTINAGPARVDVETVEPPEGLAPWPAVPALAPEEPGETVTGDVDSLPIPAPVSGEVIAGDVPERIGRREWTPTGEVGTIIDGVNVIERPKNEARPVRDRRPRRIEER